MILITLFVFLVSDTQIILRKWLKKMNGYIKVMTRIKQDEVFHIMIIIAVDVIKSL